MQSNNEDHFWFFNLVKICNISFDFFLINILLILLNLHVWSSNRKALLGEHTCVISLTDSIKHQRGTNIMHLVWHEDNSFAFGNCRKRWKDMVSSSFIDLGVDYNWDWRAIVESNWDNDNNRKAMVALDPSAFTVFEMGLALGFNRNKSKLIDIRL